jgi:hypothetical protein
VVSRAGIFGIPHYRIGVGSFSNIYYRMNRRKADFKFIYKFLEDDL